jgi:hypothetical protein
MFQSQHQTHKNPGSGWVTHPTKERFETTLFGVRWGWFNLVGLVHNLNSKGTRSTMQQIIGEYVGAKIGIG